jgi:hypothetical protein
MVRANMVRKIALLFIAVTLAVPFGFGQDPAAGILPFSTQAGGPYDSVDLATSSITLQIPVRSKIGKIPFAYRLVGASHVFKYYNSDSGQWFWRVGYGLGGQPFVADLAVRVPSSRTYLTYCNGSHNDLVSVYGPPALPRNHFALDRAFALIEGHPL